ncbi:MAG: hypothetical protein AB7H97_20035 [Pseudobdellovibrionaceae bacterium]
MAAKKKSNNINKNYPVLGYRVTKAERDEFIARFEALVDLLREQPEYRRINLKKNAVFLAALDFGIEHFTKKKSLG